MIEIARYVLARIPLIQNCSPRSCRTKIEHRVLDPVADTVTMLTSSYCCQYFLFIHSNGLDEMLKPAKM